MLNAEIVGRRAAYLMFDIHNLAMKQPAKFKLAAWLSRELFLEMARTADCLEETRKEKTD